MSWTFTAVALSCCIAVAVFAVLIFTKRVRLPRVVETSLLVGTLREIDSGTFRVVWSTYQIVQSATWSLDVQFPEPFSTLAASLSVFSLDFLALECFFGKTNHLDSVTPPPHRSQSCLWHSAHCCTPYCGLGLPLVGSSRGAVVLKWHHLSGASWGARHARKFWQERGIPKRGDGQAEADEARAPAHPPFHRTHSKYFGHTAC